MSNELQTIKRKAAQTLVSYAGGVPAARYTGYNGASDQFVHFTGQSSSFANEVGTERSFVLTIDTTAAAAAQEVILFPSLGPTAGYLIAADGVVGGGATGFQPATFSSNPSTLRYMQEFVKHFPSRVVGMQISSSNELLHTGGQIDVYSKDPFKKVTEPRTIRFGHHVNEYKNQLSITTVKDGFQVDAKTEVRMNLPANTTATVTFFFGARLDQAEALRDKAKLAGANPL